MTLFIFALIFGFSALACLAVRRSAKSELARTANRDDLSFDEKRDRDTARAVKAGTAIGAGVLGAFTVALFLWSCFSQVGTGKVGIVTSFGKVKSSTGSGLVFHMPWEKVVEINVQNQRIHYNGFATDGDGTLKDGNNGILAFSKETQNVYVAATVNLHVDQTKATDLYRETGTDYINKLVDARVANFFKEETVKYAATDVAPSRESIRDNVRPLLEKELAPYGIVVTDLLIDNIGFDKPFEDAIVNKQVETQKAQAAQAGIATATAQASQKVETAKGDANAAKAQADGNAYVTKTNAAAQAQANRELAASLTPELIESQRIAKLNPGVQTIIVDSNTFGLFDPTKVAQANK